MDPFLTILIALVSILAGAVLSWLSSRYYYLKSKPEMTAVRAMIAAAQKERQSELTQDIDKKPHKAPLSLVLQLIEAYENHDIYFSELVVCVRTFQSVGELLIEPLEAAQEAATQAGPTLTPSWHEAYEGSFVKGLRTVKAEVESRLRAMESSG